MIIVFHLGAKTSKSNVFSLLYKSVIILVSVYSSAVLQGDFLDGVDVVIIVVAESRCICLVVVINIGG